MNHIIIKIESGVVADVYSIDPLSVTIVDHDTIEGGEPLEERMKKAVMPMTAEQLIRPEEIARTVEALVLECKRPIDRGRTGPGMMSDEVAA